MGRRSWGVVLAVVAGLAVGAPGASGQGGGYWDPSISAWKFTYGDASITGTIKPPWQEIQEGVPGRISIAPSPTDSTKKVLKVYLHPDDRWRDSNRAEVYARHGNVNDYSNWPDGDLQERWYTWSTYLPSNFPKIDKWAIIFQWHSMGEGVPPLAVNVEHGQLQLNHSPDGTNQNMKQLWHSGNEEINGRWHTFRAHIRFSPVPGLGFVDFWHNNRQVVSGLDKGLIATERCCANQGGVLRPFPNYLKMGLYRAIERDPDGTEIAFGGAGTLYHGPLRIYTKPDHVVEPTPGE